MVLDIMLPGIDGLKLCARLREAGEWAPILMLTAKGGERDEAHALDTGADDFLAKPFSYICCSRAFVHSCAAVAWSDPPRCGGRRPPLGPLRSSGLAGRRGRRADATAVLVARTVDAARGEVLSNSRSSRTYGTSRSTATPTSSRCTSASCAVALMSRSGARPFSKPAIGYYLDPLGATMAARSLRFPSSVRARTTAAATIVVAVAFKNVGQCCCCTRLRQASAAARTRRRDHGPMTSRPWRPRRRCRTFWRRPETTGSSRWWTVGTGARLDTERRRPTGKFHLRGTERCADCSNRARRTRRPGSGELSRRRAASCDSGRGGHDL